MKSDQEIRGLLRADRRILLAVLAGLLLLGNLLVYHDCDLYTVPIVKITAVVEKQAGTVSGELGVEEPQVIQTLTGIVQNGTEKGKQVTLTNTWSYSRMQNTQYHKGDFLFVRHLQTERDISKSQEDADQKRDYFLSSLFSILLFGAAVVAGRRGLSFILAFLLNTAVLVTGIICSEAGAPFVLVTVLLILVFGSISIFCCLSDRSQRRMALTDTFLSVAILALLYGVVLLVTPPMDYTLQNYIRSARIDPGVYFTCGTLIGSLGAIMDVAASVTGGAAELLRRDPEIGDAALQEALRRIGQDVLGTMINVLFYTYLVGCIPILMVRIANGLSIPSLIQYYFAYEILRFLAGAAGIALCVPISIAVAMHSRTGKKVSLC